MKKILFAASECMPFAASGGLGDVIGSLPVALKKEQGEDIDIRVVIPLYTSIEEKYRSQMVKLGEIYISLAWRRQYCGIYMLEKDEIIYYFIDNEYYFNRSMLYGQYDDGERYAFFCKAVLEIMPVIDFFPNILHAHDWQAALSVVYLKYKYGLLENYRDIKTIFTIHNIQYQGRYGLDIISDVFDLSLDDSSVVEYNGDVNLMKGAIVCCDKLSTVSPTYANEILEPKYSHGLHYVLEKNKYKLSGILNGIDTVYYNPAKDKDIFVNYSSRSIEKKVENKLELQKMLSLPINPDIPMLTIISRLTEHKGLDLLTLAAEDILENNIQLVILGRGDYYYENFFYRLAEQYPGKVNTILAFNKDLSKKIYAASDIFIMPSASEPCGLSQMIASRYGSVPLVRETGGLYDSIKDIGWEGGGNGFTFAPYSSWELMNAVKRAISCYENKEFWNELVKKVMNTNFSWKKSAKEYLNSLYTF
ncbi:glycogen synthase GlgA [Eubacteriales bacterium OttesenSCG-928-G02]|nr:glycogen synthase GlgA [Eubacteriales bacterium OttesenSCG-928-G02]